MPKVSVVMPVFNGERYIREAINSVLCQSSVDLELVVVNDGSTDKTVDIVQTFVEADQRVRLITRPNSGRPSIAKNDGILAARGEYICFLDHDDLYDADRTSQMVDGLDRHPDWVAAFHDLRLIDSAGVYFEGTYLSNANFLERARPYLTSVSDGWFECNESFFIYQSLVTAALHTQSVLIARNRIPEGTTKFDTLFTICEDTDLWIRLGLLGKIGYLNQVLSSYRQHETSITQNQERYLLDAVQMHKHNYVRIEKKLSATEVQQYRLKISSFLLFLGYFRYEQYRLLDARAAYFEAINWAPSREAFLGYVKSLIPEAILRHLKVKNA